MIYSYDNKSLIRDGKRWFPVMGEIHYSRYPSEFWKESLLKMKMCGVDVVSTYVIWIHHEEIEGNYDFSGDKDLHKFVENCKECRIKLWLRIGPWVHAEVRNGGFPDWLLNKDFECRTNDDKYFSEVEKWYKRIYQEVKEFFCTEENPENPILGVQIENEFGHCGGLYDETGELHMKKLLKMAKDIGFNVPYYTATGWGGARTGGMIPVMGGYCDAPWDPRTTEIEPSGNYVFTYERNDHNIGSDFGLGEGITFDAAKFPYLTAELGGGLQMTQHRRTVASAKDIASVSVVKLGSGVNLLGYYMFHGGTNPDGKLTSLQESKQTGSLNDLPEKSYDFNAPVREYGQISDIYKELKLLFIFVKDFGSDLCSLPAIIPEDNPLKPENLTDLRYSFRTDGKRGYLFINNYVRLRQMNEHKDIQIKLPDGEQFPKLNVQNGEFFFLPYNMIYGGLKIKSASCTPFCILCDGTTVFYSREKSSQKENFFQFDEEENSENKTNSSTKLLVISRNNALNAWKTDDGHIIICEDNIIQEEKNIFITKRSSGLASNNLKLLVYPPLEKVPECLIMTGKQNINQAEDLPEALSGVYELNCTDSLIIDESKIISFSEKQNKKGKKLYSLDLSNAIEMLGEKEKRLHIENDKSAGNSLNDIFIKIFYEGESARLYEIINGKRILIADNFYSGKEYPWEIGLKRFALSKNYTQNKEAFKNLELEINPLSSEDNIYFETKPDFSNGELCRINSINAEPEWIFKI